MNTYYQGCHMMLQGQVEALILKCSNDHDLQVKLFEIYENLFTKQ